VVCLQGASAAEKILRQFEGKPVRAFIVWEPVLLTDWGAPSTATLNRIPDSGAAQFWDKGRLISHLMGERNRSSVVWDYIAIYPAGAIWKERPPHALYSGGPVVRATEAARAALAQALHSLLRD
jgi:hypothetical protein